MSYIKKYENYLNDLNDLENKILDLISDFIER